MDNEQIFEACARASHESNRAYCIALGDNSLTPWEDAPEWQTTSVLKGVKGVLLDGNGPAQSHASWLEEKARTGWKYGEKKDPEAKTHPCFLPYDDLPAAQKKKDAIFVTVVKLLAVSLGFDQQPGHVAARIAEIEKNGRSAGKERVAEEPVDDSISNEPRGTEPA